MKIAGCDIIHLRFCYDWHCLVSNLLDWRSSIERLMRSLKIIVLHKLYEPLADASVTAHPRIMEAVDSHFEGVNHFSMRFRST